MKTNRILLVLALGVFGITTTEFAVIGILPEIATAFHVSIDKAGLLLSAFAIIVAVFGPFMMIMLSSFDRRKLMIISLTIFSLSNILSVFAPNFYALLVVRMLPAFFHPVYWSIALSVGVQKSSAENSANAVSIIFSGLTIATVLGVPMATFVSDFFNWSCAFILSALINIISLIGLMLFLPDIKTPPPQESFPKRDIFHNKLLWTNFTLAFLLITAMYTTYGYMADYLKNVSGMNGREVSFMLLLFGTLGIFGNKLAGKYMSKLPAQTTLFFMMALLAIHLLLYWLGSFYLPVIMVTAVWGLIHTGGYIIANINVTSSMAHAHEFTNSIFTSCGNFAVTAGSLAGGYWIAHFGIHQVIWSTVGCLIMALLVILYKHRMRYARIF